MCFMAEWNNGLIRIRNFRVLYKIKYYHNSQNFQDTKVICMLSLVLWLSRTWREGADRSLLSRESPDPSRLLLHPSLNDNKSPAQVSATFITCMVLATEINMFSISQESTKCSFLLQLSAVRTGATPWAVWSWATWKQIIIHTAIQVFVYQ